MYRMAFRNAGIIKLSFIATPFGIYFLVTHGNIRISYFLYYDYMTLTRKDLILSVPWIHYFYINIIDGKLSMCVGKFVFLLRYSVVIFKFYTFVLKESCSL
jgi:hypothetical protein